MKSMKLLSLSITLAGIAVSSVALANDRYVPTGTEIEFKQTLKMTIPKPADRENDFWYKNNRRWFGFGIIQAGIVSTEANERINGDQSAPRGTYKPYCTIIWNDPLNRPDSIEITAGTKLKIVGIRKSDTMHYLDEYIIEGHPQISGLHCFDLEDYYGKATPDQALEMAFGESLVEVKLPKTLTDAERMERALNVLLDIQTRATGVQAEKLAQITSDLRKVLEEGQSNQDSGSNQTNGSGR